MPVAKREILNNSPGLRAFPGNYPRRTPLPSDNVNVGHIHQASLISDPRTAPHSIGLVYRLVCRDPHIYVVCRNAALAWVAIPARQAD